MFTYSIKQACEIRKFHVAGVQRRQRNVQNSVMHVQICCFVNKNLLLFLPFSFRRRRRWFCCHPEIVLPWWRDVILLSIFHWYISVIGAWFHWLSNGWKARVYQPWGRNSVQLLALPKVEASGHLGHPPPLNVAVVNGWFLDDEQVLKTNNSQKTIREEFQTIVLL